MPVGLKLGQACPQRRTQLSVGCALYSDHEGPWGPPDSLQKPSEGGGALLLMSTFQRRLFRLRDHRLSQVSSPVGSLASHACPALATQRNLPHARQQRGRQEVIPIAIREPSQRHPCERPPERAGLGSVGSGHFLPSPGTSEPYVYWVLASCPWPPSADATWL